jgi:hypothetical protein
MRIGTDLLPLDAEQRLIGAILAADWRSTGKRAWPDALFVGIDWTKLAGLAWQHKIRPMAAAALREAGWPGVPAAVRAELEAWERDAVAQGIRQVALLRTIVAMAEAADLRMIVLKGVALSSHLYADPFIREAYDLDLLVHPQEVDRLDAILVALGCASETPPMLGPRQTAALRRFHHDRKFVHAASGTIIELHDALDRNPHLIETDFDRLWAARQEVAVADYTVAMLGPVDLPHYLGTHAARHAWERWKWIADLAVLYTRGTRAQWDVLRAEAARRGIVALFDSWVLIVAATTDSPLPDTIVSVAGENPRAGALARGALRFSAAPRPPGALSQSAHLRSSRYRLGLRREPAYWRFELAGLFHRDADWYRLPLPDRLIALRYLISPILYLGRRLGLDRA